jgi:g-D-glutamyl-meso-diaminopimelate peptidase
MGVQCAIFLLAGLVGPSPAANSAAADGAHQLVTDPTRAYSAARVAQELGELAERYPDLIAVSQIGQAVSGTPILLATLGTGPRAILVLASEHAREYVTTGFAMRTLDTYARAAALGERIEGIAVREALSEVTFYIVPMVNPDGVAIAQGTASDAIVRLAKKAVGSGYYKAHRAEWKANGRGVDLNRNYPVNWRRAKIEAKGPAFQLYKGTSAGSEPEVRAVLNLAKSRDFDFMITLHTKGEVVYWRDTYSPTVPGAHALAAKVKAVMGYPLVQVGPQSDTSLAGGASANWFRATYGRPALTIEFTPMSEPFASAPRDFNRLIWSRGRALLLRLL